MKSEYDFSKARRGPVEPLPPGKTRITIRLDDDLLAWFKAQVTAAGGGNYQTLINSALREHVRGKRERLEETLRRVLREELSQRNRVAWRLARHCVPAGGRQVHDSIHQPATDGHGAILMKTTPPHAFNDGDRCTVIAGTHSGKSGTVRDIKTSKTGHVTVTVVQVNGVRFKTLAKNVRVQPGEA